MAIKKKFSKLYHSTRTGGGAKFYTAGLAIVLIACVGAYLQFSGQAATPTVSFEAEAGIKTGQAISISDTTASGGTAIQFSSSTPSAQNMLMCVSDGPNDHGGTNDWDAFRVYRESPMLAIANRTGDLRPKALAYSESGPNLGGTNPNYTTVYNHVLSKLNTFYYTNATGQTQSARWGIKLYWSNGNENYDKGALAVPHTAAGINAFVTSQRALYEAVHFVDPTTGQRRFPDAYAGSNPIHEAEKEGILAEYLNPSAPYHDFIMWSMYPVGRKVTAEDPTFNWPTFTESQRETAEGFMIRAFYRTKQTEAVAGHPIMIAVGEVGIGNDPDDGTTRPYYAAHGLAHSFVRLANQYNLAIPFACWWDEQLTGVDAPQNILSDEQPGLSPTTREAWQNWTQYDHLKAGTHPTSWTGNPKPAWKVTGTPPTQ